MNLLRPPLPDVLYLDTRQANLLAMQMVFRHRPHYVLRPANYIGEALRLARMHPRTGLLLIDPDAADGDAVADVLATLRALPGHEHTPAIALTADGGFDIEGAGFDERWTKPIDARAILPRLDAWLAGERRPARRAVVMPPLAAAA